MPLDWLYERAGHWFQDMSDGNVTIHQSLVKQPRSKIARGLLRAEFHEAQTSWTRGARLLLDCRTAVSINRSNVSETMN
jgi:hypothetical protein